MADLTVAADSSVKEQCVALELADTDDNNLKIPDAPVEPKGTWLHAAYHLTSGTMGPQTLSLPFAIASLGWGPGLFFLFLGGAVSFYAYYLQTTVLENLAKQSGKRCERFRDLSLQVVGRRWTSYLVAPLQFVVCFATVVSCIVLGGQSMKAIFQGQELSLYQFTIVFGCLHMLLSQLPSLHSLRHLNLLSLIASVTYGAFVVYSSIYAGTLKELSRKNYTISGTNAGKLFGVFNSLSILSNIYGNVIIVEIQATIKPPSSKNMLKGLCMCYAVMLITIIPIAISGYWAFGNISNGVILMNIFPPTGSIQYVPKWMCILVNLLIFVQLIVSSLMYSQPTYDVLEKPMLGSKKTYFSARNIISRLLSRSIFTVFATLLAAMVPYFGSLNALIGAIGYTPLVFVVPIIFDIIISRPLSQYCIKLWVNYIMVVVFSIITMLGCIASSRQFLLDAKMYHLFANL